MKAKRRKPKRRRRKAACYCDVPMMPIEKIVEEEDGTLRVYVNFIYVPLSRFNGTILPASDKP